MTLKKSKGAECEQQEGRKKDKKLCDYLLIFLIKFKNL